MLLPWLGVFKYLIQFLHWLEEFKCKMILHNITLHDSHKDTAFYR